VCYVLVILYHCPDGRFSVAVTRSGYQRSYSTLGLVSAYVSERLWTGWVNRLGAEPGTQAYSA